MKRVRKKPRPKKRGPKPKPRSELKRESVHVQLTGKQKRSWERAAVLEGFPSTSAWIRASMDRKAEKAIWGRSA